MSKKLVIALGGNALGKNNKEQLELVKKTATQIVNLVKKGYEIVITHGNGPQVGMISSRMEKENENKIPFPECGAMSEGYIGYHLAQALKNEFTKRKMNKNCVTVVTQVLVNKEDKAFKNPTKPIGKFYTKEEAINLSEKTGDTYKEDAGRGYRKVVASPKPKQIIEISAIKALISTGSIVIACGGGGIPVVLEKKELKGIDAVIDKDLTSALLAKEINADILLILTNIDKVCINFNKENQQELDVITTTEAQNYINKNEFVKGSMLPKVEACLKFVLNTNKKAIITSLDKAEDGIDGKMGTVICSSKKEEIKNGRKKENC